MIVEMVNYEQATFGRNEWLVRPPVGTPLEALLIPTFWRHHGGRLRVGDKIEVLPVDGSYDAELRVYAVDKLYAKVRVLREWRSEVAAAIVPADTDSMPDEVEGVAVNFAKAHKWRVMDAVTGEIIDKGFSTKDDALDARDAYLKKRAA